MGAMTDTTVATNSYDSYDSYNGYIRHKCRIAAKVTITKDFIGAKTAARAITTIGAAIDIGPGTFTRAIAASKSLAEQGF